MKFFFGLFISLCLTAIFVQAASLTDRSRVIHKRQLRPNNGLIRPELQQFFQENNIPPWAAVQDTTWGARIFF